MAYNKRYICRVITTRIRIRMKGCTDELRMFNNKKKTKNMENYKRSCDNLARSRFDIKDYSFVLIMRSNIS